MRPQCTQAFDTAAALALLGYKPPPKPTAKKGAKKLSKKALEEEATNQHPDLLAVLQRRSIRAFQYMTAKVRLHASR